MEWIIFLPMAVLMVFGVRNVILYDRALRKFQDTVRQANEEARLECVRAQEQADLEAKVDWVTRFGCKLQDMQNMRVAEAEKRLAQSGLSGLAARTNKLGERE